MICLRCICPICGKQQRIEVKEVDWADWRNGKSIQDAFRYLTAAQREAVMTGICSDCFPKDELEEA